MVKGYEGVDAAGADDAYSIWLRTVLQRSVGRCDRFLACGIAGFRDTYLGRQVVSRPGAGMGSAGIWGALRVPLAGSGAEPQPKSNLVPF